MSFRADEYWSIWAKKYWFGLILTMQTIISYVIVVLKEVNLNYASNQWQNAKFYLILNKYTGSSIYF